MCRNALVLNLKEVTTVVKSGHVTKCPFIKDGEEKNGILKIRPSHSSGSNSTLTGRNTLFSKHQWRSDSGGLRIVWGAYFGAMLMKVVVRTAHLEVPLNSSLNQLKGNVQKCKIICYLALGFYFFFFFFKHCEIHLEY